MPAIPKAKRYFQPGITKLFWLTTAVDYTALTLAEITAGTELTKDLAEIAGWEVTSNSIDTPDFASRFTSKVPGLTSVSDSSLTFYGSSDGQDVRQTLSRDDIGYLVAMDGGQTAGNVMDVYPATVASLGKVRSNSDAYKIQVSFTITAVPSEDQTIPTT
jgi:hypothetical protein